MLEAQQWRHLSSTQLQHHQQHSLSTTSPSEQQTLLHQTPVVHVPPPTSHHAADTSMTSRHQPTSSSSSSSAAAATAAWMLRDWSCRHGRTKTTQYISYCCCSRSSSFYPADPIRLCGNWHLYPSITSRASRQAASKLRRGHSCSDPTASASDQPGHWAVYVHVASCRHCTSIACSVSDPTSSAAVRPGW